MFWSSDSDEARPSAPSRSEKSHSACWREASDVTRHVTNSRLQRNGRASPDDLRRHDDDDALVHPARGADLDVRRQPECRPAVPRARGSPFSVCRRALFVSYGSQARVFTDDTVMAQVTSVNDASSTVAFGVRGLLGVIWRLHPHFSLFAEYDARLRVQHGAQPGRGARGRRVVLKAFRRRGALVSRAPSRRAVGPSHHAARSDTRHSSRLLCRTSSSREWNSAASFGRTGTRCIDRRRCTVGPRPSLQYTQAARARHHRTNRLCSSTNSDCRVSQGRWALHRHPRRGCNGRSNNNRSSPRPFRTAPWAVVMQHRHRALRGCIGNTCYQYTTS